MLEKGMQKTGKVLQNGTNVVMEIEKKSIKTKSENRCEKMAACPDLPGGSADLNHLVSSRVRLVFVLSLLPAVF